jgi:hypothetical protein
MALGLPDIGTGTLYYSQYDASIVELLARIYDNNTNAIVAKDVRDAIWSLYNNILLIGSQSYQNLYTLGTPSTISVGGVTAGTTFSNITFQNFLDTLLLPYVKPVVQNFYPSLTELQFGQSTPISLNYSIDVGSVPLSSINFTGPYLPISSNTPTGLDPDNGVKGSITPTYSTTVSVVQPNVFTMSMVTSDLLSFSATTSVTYKHKRYYGPLNIPIGFTPSIPSSVLAVQSFLSDTVIKGLSYSELAVNVNISQAMSFNNQYLIFAAPTVFGFNFPTGFYIDNVFSQDFTKIKSGVTFSNEFSYKAPYDVWISNVPYTENVLVSNISQSVGNTSSIYSVIIGNAGLPGATGATGINGLMGATGATGINGLMGATGATGASLRLTGITHSFQINDGYGGLTGIGLYADYIAGVTFSSIYINDNVSLSLFSTIIGIGSGPLSTGASNTFIGYNTGNSNTSGSNNLFLGVVSGQSNTTGCENTFLGHASGQCGTTASENTFIGSGSGTLTTVGSRNVYVGKQSGGAGTQSCGNTYAGYNSGGCSTGSDNVFIGEYAGSNVTGSHNVVIGDFAGCSFTSSCYNTFVGSQAGMQSSGFRNTFIGLLTGFTTKGSSNTFIGEQSGYGNISGSSNTYIGAVAGFSATSSVGSVVIGEEAGRYNYASNVTLIGAQAGCCNTSAGNVFIGYFAGRCNGAATGNTYIGYNSGGGSIGGNNTFIGYQTGANTVGGGGNVFIGTNAGVGNMGGNDNIFIGQYTGTVGTMSCSNIFIGSGSGYYVSTSCANLFIGRHTGDNTNGSCNIFFGDSIGFGLVQSGSGNIFIGVGSGATYSNSFAYSVALGFGANIDNSHQLSIGSSVGYIGTASTSGSVSEYMCVTINGQKRKIALLAL